MSGASPRRPAVALTLGKFDGVHLGHRRLASTLIETAERLGAESAALVIHPDPAEVLRGARVPLLLPPALRRARLEALGLGRTGLLPFTPALSQLSPEDFVARLARRYRLRAMVVGPDFAFGRGRSGNLATLAELGRARGFELRVVEPLVADGMRVSSGRIRALVEAGDIAAARRLLAAPPWLEGRVVRGAARGRLLGFPTANLRFSAPFVLPADGIYAVRAAWSEPGRRALGPWQAAVASIGVRPTFDPGPRLVEVHVLDFQGGLYGRRMAVEVLARQRGEERFDSVEALVAQMHADVERTRAILAAEAGPGP